MLDQMRNSSTITVRIAAGIDSKGCAIECGKRPAEGPIRHWTAIDKICRYNSTFH